LNQRRLHGACLGHPHGVRLQLRKFVVTVLDKDARHIRVMLTNAVDAESHVCLQHSMPDEYEQFEEVFFNAGAWPET
jgi:hypothetical protein